MKRIPSINKKIIWRKINNEVVLLNPENGKYFGLNCVGCSLLEKIDGKRDLDEIMNMLTEEYDVLDDILSIDIEELLTKMESHDILKIVNE